MLTTKENIHTFVFEVEEKYTGKTIKQYLRAHDFSVSLLIKIKNEGKVYLNNTESMLYQEVCLGDTLIIDIGRESLDTESQDITIEIIYEDHDLLVVNKEPFIVTHPLRRYPNGTLANAVAHYFCENGIEAKIRFVNRLDKNTSGIIIISKNRYAHHYVQQQIKERNVKKVYWAVVSGIFDKKEGVIDAPIGRESQQSITRSIMDSGQKSVTYYRVLEEFTNASLVELVLKTGRTHQLRVHMQYLGHPILGDDLYNDKKCEYIARQALHAKEIEFVLPRKTEKIVLTAPLSEDIKDLIQKCS